jgi:hypothetical protein
MSVFVAALPGLGHYVISHKWMRIIPFQSGYVPLSLVVFTTV